MTLNAAVALLLFYLVFYFLFYFLQLYCPHGISPMGNWGCRVCVCVCVYCLNEISRLGNLGCLPLGMPAATFALPNLGCMLGIF